MSNATLVVTGTIETPEQAEILIAAILEDRPMTDWHSGILDERAAVVEFMLEAVGLEKGMVFAQNWRSSFDAIRAVLPEIRTLAWVAASDNEDDFLSETDDAFEQESEGFAPGDAAVTTLGVGAKEKAHTALLERVRESRFSLSPDVAAHLSAAPVNAP